MELGNPRKYGEKVARKMLRKLDLDTKYFRIVVWNRRKEVQWLVQCRPEKQARYYADAVNHRTRTTGFRAQLVEIALPSLPSYPLSKLN